MKSITSQIEQKLENLPTEILALPRFFKVKTNKQPITKGWSNPDNQKLYSQVSGLAGFDTAAHGKGAEYLLLDFDHVLDDNGEFVADSARELFTSIHSKLNSYCELSASKRGIHIIARPTAGKFARIAAGERNGVLYFDRDNDVKLEIFYATAGRYCLCTGNVFHCEPKTDITSGEVVDNVFQSLLDRIAEQNKADLKKTEMPKKKTVHATNFTNADDYDSYRAEKMVRYIPISDLSGTEWLCVMSTLKNLGYDYGEVDRLNQGGAHYDETENRARWESLNDKNFDIGTLHGLAKNYGYSEADARREWHELHPETCADNRDNRVRTRDKIKDCPVDLIIPEEFIWTESGISQKIPSKKNAEEFKYLPVTKTPIIITKKFLEPTKGTVEFEIAIRVGGKWKFTALSGQSLVDVRQLTVLGDYDAIINDIQRLKQFFDSLRACNPTNLNEIKSYNKTGWTDGDCGEFIYPHEKADYIVRRAGFDYNKILTKKGNSELWKEKFLETIRIGGATVAAYFGVALAAPLAEPIIGVNPSAHLYGKSGGGKTALLKFISSVFGNPRELLRTFAATNKNRLLTAAAFDGLPTFFDELETITGKTAEEQLSNDIYNFYDGRGNQANRRNGDARETFRFRASRLTTGERPILRQNDLRGAFKRLLPLEVKAGFLPDEFAAELHFVAEKNFGHFGKIWVDFVKEHLQEIETQYIAFAKRYVSLRKYEPTHLKMLAAACVSLEFFCVAIGAKAAFDKASCISIFHAISNTLPTNAELDDTARAVTDLKSFVAAHERYFIAENKGNPNEEAQIAYASETYGKIFNSGEVAFFATSLRKILETELGFANSEKLINEWYQQGGVLITATGRKTDVVKVGKKNQRVYHFCAGVLSEADDSAEEKYYSELANA